MESNPHKVPKGFFEEQRADILNAIKNETSNSSHAITISIFKTMLKAAASIGTIIFAVGIGPAVALGLYLASYFPKKD